MYVDFSKYTGEVTEDEYTKAAPLADLIIDHWTLDRVGRAVNNGEELPECVITLYMAIIDAIPSLENASVISNDEVVSFSNGIDSYSFETTKTVEEKLFSSLGWMIDLLPVEWISGVVNYEGGNAR